MGQLTHTARMVLRPSEGTTGQTALMVMCSIGTQQYSFMIEHVREVVRLPALLSLVGAPPYLCGLLNLRGAYLPILDGRVLMGLSPQHTLSSQIIIVGHTAPQSGLLVDEVHGVYALPLNSMTPITRHAAAAFLRGVVSMQDGSVILIDLNALLSLVPDDIE